MNRNFLNFSACKRRDGATYICDSRRLYAFGADSCFSRSSHRIHTVFVGEGAQPLIPFKESSAPESPASSKDEGVMLVDEELHCIGEDCGDWQLNHLVWTPNKWRKCILGSVGRLTDCEGKGDDNSRGCNFK